VPNIEGFRGYFNCVTNGVSLREWGSFGVSNEAYYIILITLMHE
jgi:hypothetical protein